MGAVHRVDETLRTCCAQSDRLSVGWRTRATVAIDGRAAARQATPCAMKNGAPRPVPERPVSGARHVDAAYLTLARIAASSFSIHSLSVSTCSVSSRTNSLATLRISGSSVVFATA